MKIKLTPVIILLITLIVFCILPFIIKDVEFLNYNLLDVVTGIGVAYGIYYFSKINDEKHTKAAKIDEVIDVFRRRLITLFDKPVDVENNKEEYYHTFKYLDNKFNLLKHMTKDFDCSKEVENIENNLDKIKTFITDNINEKNEYFVKNSERREKIPNLIDTIEVQLDNITIKLFSFDTKK